MFDYWYRKIAATRPIILIGVALLAFGCTTEQFKEIHPKGRARDSRVVVAYGYARISPNAPSNQITLARQKARMLAATNLAAQIWGIEFVYDTSKKQAVSLHKFQAYTRGKIQGAVTKYYPSGRSGVLVKQALKTKKAIPNLPGATVLKTAFRTQDMAKSLPGIYREAVVYTISRKFSSRKKASGKIYLRQMQISDYNRRDDIQVTVELQILVN